MGFGQSRFTPRYGSFPRTAPRISILSQGRVNPVQFAGLDRPLAKLIPPCTYPARLDTSQDRRFRPPDSFRGLPKGVTHALRSVPCTDPRNGAAGTVDGGLTSSRSSHKNAPAPAPES